MNTNKQVNPITHYTGKLRVRICGILIEEKKILLVRHKGIAGKYNLWSPPGGGLAYGEKVKDCLVREFKEETGLEVKPIRFLFMQEYLQEPLHALELFFEVTRVSGELKTGYDPELGFNAQLIQEVAFKTLPELRNDKEVKLHQIFTDLVHLDDIFLPVNRFLN